MLITNQGHPPGWWPGWDSDLGNAPLTSLANPSCHSQTGWLPLAQPPEHSGLSGSLLLESQGEGTRAQTTWPPALAHTGSDPSGAVKPAAMCFPTFAQKGWLGEENAHIKDDLYYTVDSKSRVDGASACVPTGIRDQNLAHPSFTGARTLSGPPAETLSPIVPTSLSSPSC